MKVEIEIKKRDLHNIFCAALRHYYCDLQSYVDDGESDVVLHSEIVDNLYDIRGACDAISHLCDLIEDLDGVEEDNGRGVIGFDDSKENDDVGEEEER